MNVQEVFNKVIDSGCYNKGNCSLMCPALGVARRTGEINQDEYQLGIDAIKDYLKGYGSLGGKLLNMKLDYMFEDRLRVYQNWEARP